MNLFGVGPGEALLVLVIALMVVGPGRFPEIAREAGRWYRMARRYSAEVMSDVRAAVDELESEVSDPGDDLRSIREIGTEFREDLRAAGRSVSEIGREARTMAETETGRAITAANETPAAPPVADGATHAVAPAPDDAPATAPPAADERPAPAEQPPAPKTESPASIRPSKRARPAGAPVDPFEALEAKRARERARDADNAHN